MSDSKCNNVVVEPSDDESYFKNRIWNGSAVRSTLLISKLCAKTTVENDPFGKR